MIKLIHGDCIKELKQLEDNSIDSLVTDPPYGISFMGKKWDYDVPGVEVWQECLRVLKPGGTALIFAGSRTQHRMAVNIEDAGFILKDCIMWLYGSGFPKATDISKQLDKKVLINDLFEPFSKHYKKQRKQSKLTHNQICEKGKFYDKHNHGGASSNWELGLNVPTLKQWNILKPLLNLSDDFIPLIERIEAEREIIEKRELCKTPQIPSCGNQTEKHIVNITEPSTPEAKLWNGWKSHGLKPAYEPILVCMKPNEGSYAQNALEHGVAGLNIDGGKIDHNEPVKTTKRKQRKAGWNMDNTGFDSTKNDTASASPQGRFPANVILDEEAARMLDEQSGKGISSKFPPTNKPIFDTEKGWNNNSIKGGTGGGYSDTGGASRFFYCAKASKAERHKGCKDLKDVRAGMRSNTSGQHITRRDGGDPKTTKNNHPTVKPLKLMEYLCTLTKTPTGGIVLDPFMGSGTTGIACVLTDRDFIGIEKEAEYIKIAKRRIE